MIILNKALVHSSGEMALMIFLCPVIVFSLIHTVLKIIDKDTVKAVIFGIISALLIMMLCFSIKPNTTRYELFISDDSIPYTEFCKHWKVIENDGNIITAERLDDFPVCHSCNVMYENDFTMLCPNCGEIIRNYEE